MPSTKIGFLPRKTIANVVTAICITTPSPRKHYAHQDEMNSQFKVGKAMNNYVKLASIVASILLVGCEIPAARIAASVGAMPAYTALSEPNYDTPIQVIYVVDKDRFFTSENYEECSSGHIYYNDKKNKIKTELKNALALFPGRLLLNGDPNILVFPSSFANGIGACGHDRGCSLAMYYSLDGGKTFGLFHPWRLSVDLKESYEIAKSLTVTLQGTQLYLADKERAYVFTLEKGVNGGAQYIEGGPKSVPHVRTPSGQDHLTCDDSVHPKEIKK